MWIKKSSLVSPLLLASVCSFSSVLTGNLMVFTFSSFVAFIHFLHSWYTARYTVSYCFGFKRGVKYTAGIRKTPLPRRASGKSRVRPTSACSPRFLREDITSPPVCFADRLYCYTDSWIYAY
jgi:hypothetical protein